MTDGWEWDEKKGKAIQKFVTIGYFEKKPEALLALAEYNKAPLALGTSHITFADIFEIWKTRNIDNMTPKVFRGYINFFNHSAPLHKMKMRDIRADNLQTLLDKIEVGKPTKSKIKTLWSWLFKIAIEQDIVAKNYADFVKVNGKETAKKSKIPFTKNQIKLLWENLGKINGLDLFLIMIYTGVRPSELLDIKSEHIDLSARFIDLRGTKTPAARRMVPINKKIIPLLENRLGGQYICRHANNGRRFSYSFFLQYIWNPAIEDLEFEELTPHCCRHTAVSLLVDAGVDDRLIKKIVGHAGGDVTAGYTHAFLESLLDAIDRIEV